MQQQPAEPQTAFFPVVILAPPRSFSSVICTMIGRHPQLYGLPELQLFSAETIAEWKLICDGASYRMGDGLLRSVAQLWFGGQTEEKVRLAAGWIRRRQHMSTGLVLEILMQRVYPAIVVEKSPSIVYQRTSLDRLYRMFPNTRFMHLSRHPRGFGDSVVRANREAAKYGPVPRWLAELMEFSDPELDSGASATQFSGDPQNAWYTLNRYILGFLNEVPDNQKLRLRAEDILVDPDRWLRRIAKWIGVREDLEAVEEMKHPERSPFARFGPPSALLGNDGEFLRNPALKPRIDASQTLEGPLSWREDQKGFSRAVIDLATEFGYS